MTSSAERDSQTGKFLVDFLYADRPRLAVLAAQLFDDGHLTALKKSSQTGVDSLMKVNGGIPGIAGGETSSTDKVQESIERQFDATWAAPLNVLRELNALGYLDADVEHALLGQVVLVAGAIQVIDLRLIQKMWRPIMTQESAKAIASAAKADRAKAHKEAKETAGLVEIVEQLPHTLQFRIRSGGTACWGTLDPDQMTINPSDLAFKHGASIPGNWKVLGLLDAKPSNSVVDYMTEAVHTQGAVISGMLQILMNLRQMLGRSDSDYGVTPLAIYRTVDSAPG